MKKFLFSMVIILIIPVASIAQDVKNRIHEAGISFSSFNSFGVRYKTGSDKTLFRLTFLSVNGNNNDTKRNYTAYANNSSFGLGFNIGFEKRKSITDMLDSYSGIDIQTSYESEHQEFNQSNLDAKSWTISPGIGIILGLNYRINENLNFSAEVIPSLRYSINKSTNINNGVETNDTNTSFYYGFSNIGASLNLSYRFGKKNQL
jgi:hypothetical protein